VCGGGGVFYRYTQKPNGVRGEKKTIEISTGGGRTRTDRRTPYALAEQQRWSIVAVVTDSSVVVSSAAAAAAAAQSGYVG